MGARLVHPANVDKSEDSVTAIVTAASKIPSRFVKSARKFLAASSRSCKIRA
jgi:hypothetical protein